MQGKYRFWFLLSFILLSVELNGQKQVSFSRNDTVFHYKTITVYDTVFLFDTIRVAKRVNVTPVDIKFQGLSILQLDTLHKKANLLFVNNHQAAIIPINSIMLNENIKIIRNARKASFTGVVFYAFRSMVMAQSDFGIILGTGKWWAKCNEPITNPRYTSTYSLGAFMTSPVGRRFFTNMKLNFSFLERNYSFKTLIDSASWLVAGEGESATSYLQLSVPFQIGYHIGRLSPALGIQYTFRISSWLDCYSMSSFGLSGGVNYAISDRLLLGLDYFQGLTKENKIDGDILNPATNEKTGEFHNYWKSCRLGLTLSYTFKKPILLKAW